MGGIDREQFFLYCRLCGVKVRTQKERNGTPAPLRQKSIAIRDCCAKIVFRGNFSSWMTEREQAFVKLHSFDSMGEVGSLYRAVCAAFCSLFVFISIQLFDKCVAALTRPITTTFTTTTKRLVRTCVCATVSPYHTSCSRPASSIYDLLCHSFQDFISLFILNANSRLSDTVINQSEQRLP